MENKKFICIDGSDIYIYDDYIYIDSSSYSHFFELEDAFNYYKKVHKLLNKNKKLIFSFNNIYLEINKYTTFEIIKDKYNKEIKLIEELNKENKINLYTEYKKKIKKV